MYLDKALLLEYCTVSASQKYFTSDLTSFKKHDFEWSEIIGPLRCSKGLNIYREEEPDVNPEKRKLRVGGIYLQFLPI